MNTLAKRKVKPSQKGSSVAAGGALKAVKSGAKKVFGGSARSSSRRKKGVTYWANKVMVEKLKKRYMKIKFGGR